MLIAVAVKTFLHDRISNVKMGDIRAERADDELAGLMGDRNVGEIYEKTEIVVGHPHLGGEFCRVWSRSHEGCFVDIVVEDLEFHHHLLCLRIITECPGGLYKLGKCLVPVLGSPFSGEKGDSLRSEEFRFIDGMEKRLLCLFPFVFINGIRIQTVGEFQRLRAIADGHVALGKKLRCLLLFIRSIIALYLDCVKKVIAGELKQGVHRGFVGKTHPLECAHAEIFVDRFVHNFKCSSAS